MSSLEYAEYAPTVRRCPQDGHRSWACSLFSQSGLRGPTGSLPASSHPLSSFQTVGIETEDRIPIQQGFFRLPQLLQQHCQFAPCRGICWTNCQGILKLTNSCDPFLPQCLAQEWWFHRAFRFYCHARALFLFGLLFHTGLHPLRRFSALTSQYIEYRTIAQTAQ